MVDIKGGEGVEEGQDRDNTYKQQGGGYMIIQSADK